MNQRTNCGAWNLLGTHSFGAGATVSLSSAADGTVITDAVKFVPEPAAYDTATWTPNLAGTYDAQARWTANANRPTDARYSVSYTGCVSTMMVNQ